MHRLACRTKGGGKRGLDTQPVPTAAPYGTVHGNSTSQARTNNQGLLPNRDTSSDIAAPLPGRAPHLLHSAARPQASRRRCSLTPPIAYLHHHRRSNPPTANAIPHACTLRSLACARTVLTYRSVWDSPSLSTAGGIRTHSRLWTRGGTVGSPLVSGCVEGLRGPEGTIMY